MVECIEKAAVLNALASEGITRNMRVFRKIQDIPTGEMAQVRHGRWQTHLGWGWVWRCSCCEYKMGRKEFFKIKRDYCPNCGAKMDGEETEK